ncbi:DUF4158 domain-containing protein [Planctomycetota bacterium]
MKRQWSEQELGDRWSISHDEFELLKQRTGQNRIGFAALLKFFSVEGRFPTERREVPVAAIEYLAEQVGVEADAFASYTLTGRTCERDRAQIRSLLGFRPATVEDAAKLSEWLQSEVLPVDHKPDHIQEAAFRWLRENRLEPPAPSRFDRAINSALKAFEDDFFARCYAEIPVSSQVVMDQLLKPGESEQRYQNRHRNMRWVGAAAERG